MDKKQHERIRKVLLQRALQGGKRYLEKTMKRAMRIPPEIEARIWAAYWKGKKVLEYPDATL